MNSYSTQPIQISADQGFAERFDRNSTKKPTPETNTEVSYEFFYIAATGLH